VKAMTTFFDIMYAAHGQRCFTFGPGITAHGKQKGTTNG
jgi:hypothetical protein